MSEDLANQEWFAPYLGPDESVLWQGVPQSGFLAESKRQREGFIFMLVVALLSQSVVVTSEAPFYFKAAVFGFLISSIACVIKVFWITPARLMKSSFVITTCRVMIKMISGKDEIFFFPHTLVSDSFARKARKGRGDVLFLAAGCLPIRALYTARGGAVVLAVPSSLIFNIPNPERVQEILQDASEDVKLLNAMRD